MFDILVYLVENYFQSGDYPDPETLSKRLSAAGFEDDDISQALTWLSGLERGEDTGRGHGFGNSLGLRVYTDQELAKITAEARGFLCFLEDSDVIDPIQRELIIERIAALSEPGVDLEKVKLIVLMVLWNQKQPVDALVLEELLADHDDRYLH
jgi:Smg protein